MLVLSRKRDEAIVINEDIVITIVEIRSDKVRLGIDAPAHVKVHRSEIYEAVRTQEANTAPVSDAVAAMRNRKALPR